MQQLTTTNTDKLTSFNAFAAVRDFHIKYDAGVDEQLTEDNLLLRCKLIDEEFGEVLDELVNVYFEDERYIHPDLWDMKKPEKIDKKALTKELSDLIYVCIGTAVQLGLPLEEVFKRTHYSNMTKSTEKREDGKILKGDNYVPPNLEDLF